MLVETKLKALKPKDKLYKVADRDGLYVTVAKSGLITFRFDYQINGRRETLTIGKYPIVSLASAREKLLDANKLCASPYATALSGATCHLTHIFCVNSHQPTYQMRTEPIPEAGFQPEGITLLMQAVAPSA
ncbi:DUF4102 domain-containing protein [Serratia nematodiphila]|nr:DUF4102 domain-containing protein [Serratia nematodiphila]